MLIYFDSVICIYAVEGPRSFQARARARIAALTAASDQGVVSDLTWLECRVKPIRMSDLVALTAMENLLSAADIVRVPLTAEVFERATHIRARLNFRLGDSLHLAAAVEAGCQAFLTNDQRLSAFPDIPVEVLP